MKDKITGLVATGTNWILVAMQSDKILNYINIISAIVVTLLTGAYYLYCWYKKAKQDGKIDKEEVKQAIDIVEDTVEDIKEELKK